MLLTNQYPTLQFSKELQTQQREREGEREWGGGGDRVREVPVSRGMAEAPFIFKDQYIRPNLYR